MFISLTSGLALGLAAGVAPGPLSTLVVSQTLSYGVREGIKVAAAPLITDLPIIGLALLVGSEVAARPVPLGILSLVGAVYICYLGWESANVSMAAEKPSTIVSNSISKGILTNLLNPHPYLFWMTVGTPMLLKTWSSAPWVAFVWLTGFYLTLVGSKIALSILIGYSRRLLQSRGYLWLNRILGLVLFCFALILARDGLTLLNILPG